MLIQKRRTMKNFSKATSQYYAMLVELYINAIINKESTHNIVNKIDYAFDESEINKMIEDANLIVKKYFPKSEKCFYTGRKTKKAVADFIIDNENIELKYVSGKSTGTYFNTSISYCSEKLCFEPYNAFLKKNHSLDKLQSIVNHDVYKNFSPVSQAESSYIRKNEEYSNIYEDIKADEMKARKKYVYKFANYIIEKNLTTVVYYDMLNKYSKDNKPDKIIVYNFSNGSSTVVKPFAQEAHSLNVEVSGCSIIISNLKMTFAWQNGTALNNPTIRVFL